MPFSDVMILCGANQMLATNQPINPMTLPHGVLIGNTECVHTIFFAEPRGCSGSKMGGLVTSPTLGTLPIAALS